MRQRSVTAMWPSVTVGRKASVTIRTQMAPNAGGPTFEKAALLLRERGEAAALRRSNPSEYILSNFLQCGQCGHGFVGTSANGKGGNYRYYTCFSRQRHGANRCQQTRIRADRLEERFLNSVLNELDDGEVFLKAAEEGIKLLSFPVSAGQHRRLIGSKNLRR